MLSDIIPNYKRRYRRIAKLCKRGKVHQVGFVHLGGTRKQGVYSVSSRQLKNPEHEVRLSQFCLLYDGITRNKNLPHLADAIRNVGNRMFIEQDCGTENYNQIKGRMKQYLQIEPNETVLFVCPTEDRKARILEVGREVIPEALVACTLEDALTNPWGKILTLVDGRQGKMPGGPA